MYNATKTAITVLCEGLRHELSLVNSKTKVSVSFELVTSDLMRRKKCPLTCSSLGYILISLFVFKKIISEHQSRQRRYEYF